MNALVEFHDSRTASRGPGGTIARRSLCSHAHAVSYEPKPERVAAGPSAETPFFCEVTNHTAANQVEIGLCER